MSAPALVAVAHGSRDPRAAATVDALLAAVRRQRPGLRVVPAYLELSAPLVPDALDALAADGTREAVVVPLLLTAAYHSGVDVPREVAAAADRHPRLGLRVAEVLGPHPLLVEGLERRLREAGVRPGDSDTGVVLGAAGSSDPRADEVVRAVAAEWAATGWAGVAPAYASAAGPRVPDAIGALRAAGCRRVVVASYLLAPGRLPDQVRVAAGADVTVTAPLGDSPEIARLVLERYDRARG